MEFDPPLFVPDDGGGPYVTPYLIRRYESQLPSLAPGQELSDIWWTGRMVPGSDQLENGEPTPDECTVAVTYQDDRGHHYTDTFPLDVRLTLATTSSTSSTSLKGRLKTINDSLAKLSTSLATIAKR